MGIVERLNAIGIRQGQPADILLDSSKQRKLLHDYGIDTKKDKFTAYRCLVSSNTGSRKYRTPVLSHTSKSMIPAASLQLGIFNLLYFEKVLPLNPAERDKPPTGFELALFKIPDDKYDLRDLVYRYNLQKVYYNFLDLDEASKQDRAKVIDAYESKTYPQFQKTQEIGRKAFLNKRKKEDPDDEPQIEVLLCTDEESITEFELLMAAHSDTDLGKAK